MDDLHSRLDQREHSIRELMRLGGMPGLSLTVVTNDQPVYHVGYGVRDAENGLPITRDTIFPMCSLAKGVSAAAMGILVEQGKTTWETLAKDAAPKFQPQDKALQNETTIADLYCHRSGMSSCGQLVGGCEGNILISKDDCMRVVNHQTLLRNRRGVFVYNSTAYDLCDEAIENLSGVSVQDFVHEHIFQPLGLQRSYMNPPPNGTKDVTKAYNALDDATPWHISGPKVGVDGVGGGSGGLHSCSADLVKLYSAFMRSFNHERRTGQTWTPDSPLCQVSRLMSAQVQMDEDGTTYGFGWARAQLPCSLGRIGLNGRLIPRNMPIIGKEAPGAYQNQLVLYHQGTLPGALAVVILLPDTESIVIVMGNCLSLTDVPDWVSQMAIEELLQVPASERVDFLACARLSISVNLEWHQRIVDGLESTRGRIIAQHRSLALYTGLYVDSSGVFSVEVTLVGKRKEQRLRWAFQSMSSESYDLVHYNGDIFTWLQPRNELSRRGRWVLGNDIDPAFWKVEFDADEFGDVKHVLWQHDASVKPIVYTKKDYTV